MKMFNWNCLKCVAMSIFNVHLIKRFINGSPARLSRLSENEATRIRLKFCVIAIGYQYRVMQLAWGERRKRFVSMRTAETKQKEAKENAKSFSTHFAKRNDSAEECHNATLLMSMCVCVCVGWLLDVASLGLRNWSTHSWRDAQLIACNIRFHQTVCLSHCAQYIKITLVRLAKWTIYMYIRSMPYHMCVCVFV